MFEHKLFEVKINEHGGGGVVMSDRTIAIEEACLPAELWDVWERENREGFPEIWRQTLPDFDGVRLAEMDRYGIELAILSLTVPGPQFVADVDLAEEMARDGNNALAAAVARRPDRYAAFATLSMHDVDSACAEFERAVRELGMCGVLLNNFQVAGADRKQAVYYDDRRFDPFWDLAQQLEAPVYLHPGRTMRMPDFEAAVWLDDAAWGFAIHTGFHALRIITSGVFDRFPGAQLVLGHNGEHIVYDIWRIDNRIAHRARGCPMKKTVRQYFRANVHVTTSGQFSDPGLRHAISEIGADRIMFAIDYPYEDNEAGASWFASTPITDEERAAIGRDNAIELFKLGGRLQPALS
ncbi:MAG TPA: amidohydrolase family protein [Solirubrobacteraceae bacterium]|nr:amidohydrolase family protein [Solirubrobacteraceae bacterium]